MINDSELKYGGKKCKTAKLNYKQDSFRISRSYNFQKLNIARKNKNYL